MANRQTIGEFQPCRLVDGVRKPEGPAIAGYFPAVVSEETFYAAQAARKSRTNQQGNIGRQTANLFTGLLRDARTGTTMRIYKSSPDEQRAGCYRRLTSSRAIVGAAPIVSFQYEPIERCILTFVREVAANDLLDKPSIADRMPMLEAKLAEIGAKIAGIESEIASEADYKPLVNVLKRLHGDKETLEAEIEEERIRTATQRDSLPQDFVSTLDILDHAKEADRQGLRDKVKSLIRLAVSEIWILIEEVQPEGQSKISNCMIQVFFRNGNHRQLAVWRQGHKVGGAGIGVGENREAWDCSPPPDFDLRFWRYHCRPLCTNELPHVIKQKPIPTPDGSDWWVFARQQAS